MMKTKIKFIRFYELYGHGYADIIYTSGRIVSKERNDLPKTAHDFMKDKHGQEQYDRVFKRKEIIYQ